MRAIEPDLPLFGILTLDQMLAADAVFVPRVRLDVRDLRGSSRWCCRRWTLCGDGVRRVAADAEIGVRMALGRSRRRYCG